MVVLLDRDAHLGHHRQHLGADVLGAIDRRDREIAALGAGTMGEVAHLIIRAAVRGQFGGVELEAGVERIGGELDVVEDEELGLGAEEDRVAHAGLLQVGLGLLGNAARVALIELAGRWLDDVAEDRECRLREEWVHMGRGGVRHEQHVGGLDPLPACDR